MQVYTRNDVAKALQYDRLIDALEAAFREDTIAPARAHLKVEVPGQPDATLLLMPAWRSGKFLGVKIATIFPGNTARNEPSVNASYLLLDGTSGVLLAVLDGAELTLRRTAAASALASRYLSRPDAVTLAMVGTGKLAPHLIAAHAVVRPLVKVLVWGRRPAAAVALADSLANEPYAVSPVKDLEQAVRQADIICCATLATEPLIRGDWLKPGQHLDLVGAFRADMSEADIDAVARAQVYVDTLAGATAEGGDIIKAMQSGRLRSGDIRGELASLTRGTCPGRQTADDITLFKSVGTALEDLAAAELAVESMCKLPA